MKKAIEFIKENWIWIVSIMTMACLYHLYWYLHHVNSFTALMGSEKELISPIPEYQTSYSRGYKVGVLIKIIVTVKSFVPSIIGFTLLVGEFKYKTIFKQLFITSGAWGKVSYFFVSLLLWVFLFLMIRIYLPAADQKTSLDINLATIIILFSFLYAVARYSTYSFSQLRALNYEKTKAELSALKAQINPHFLFNILNNLYGTAIVEDSPKTAEGIQQLSRIMRHVVEETKTKRSTIEKEISFLNDYLELQKMRIPDRPNINISTNIVWDEEEYSIAPLLFIPYIENAFKYGISVNDDCFIDLNISINAGIFSFSLQNSIIKHTDKLEQGTGTGLENTAKRLALYYPNRYKLTIESNNKVFDVQAKINLK